MWQLQNITPFTATTAMFPNEQAIDTLYVLTKATFNINSKLTLVDQQFPLVESDIYWTEPGRSSIKYGSDFHIGKSATDIVMLGHAFSPGNKAVTQLDVSLKVGQVAKTVRVIGDRQWQDGMITQPQAFKSMAMVYEKAFGGMQIQKGHIIDADDRNPLGRGFSGNRSVEEMNGVPLPNLEDPEDLITQIGQKPAPACFGPIASHWQPRLSYAGTYDEQWQTTRAPFLPEDMDKRFFNYATSDLIYPGFLQGGEVVEITNMHPNGNLQFTIPRVNLVSVINHAGKKVKLNFNLESLILEPNRLLFSMVWRASLQCDKSALKVSDIEVKLQK